MRYGVVRTSPDLPPPALQRRTIETQGCDVILVEQHATASNQRILMQFLHGLRAGDELLLHGLEALEASMGDLARLFRRFHEAGVVLRIVGGPRVETLAPAGPMPRALAMLADHEARHAARLPTRRRVRTSGAALTAHQIRHARHMHRRGHTMREIGLLFRLSPNEVAVVIGGERGGAPEPGDAA